MTRLLSLLAILAGCGEAPEAPPAATEWADRVTWTTPEVPERVPFADLPAEVIAAPGGLATLAPPGGGRLDAWAVNPGDRVEAGDVVAWFQSADLSSLRAERRAADARVAQAGAEAEQARRSAASGVISRGDAEVAARRLDAAMARRDALARSLAAHADTSTADAARWAWRSPQGGRVQDITCALGPTGPDTPCITLITPGAVHVAVGVPERHLPLTEGAVEGRLHTPDGRIWPLTLASSAPALNPHTRSRTLRFVADPAPPLGASGRATLHAPATPGLTRIPLAALTRLDGAHAVMLAAGEAARPTPVRVVGRDTDFAYVDGLPTDARVATRGVFLLKSLALLDTADGEE